MREQLASGVPMSEAVITDLDGYAREHSGVIDRAAMAMWRADGGDERMGWERISARSQAAWHRRATAAWRSFAAESPQ